ncbi:MAG: c-type cytochrome [Mangrovicoccus sp.]
MKALKAALLLLGLWTAPGVAENWEAAEPQERCALCHGYFGNDPRGKFPKLAGQKPSYIAAQIQAFLDGHRRNDGGQMVKTVTEITADDIPVVVDWFSSQDPPTPTPVDTEDLGQTGQQAWTISRCGECHGITDAGVKDAPHLTAQHPAYLAKQMQDFRTGQRSMKDPDKIDAIKGLTDAEVTAIAAYLGALPRLAP